MQCKECKYKQNIANTKETGACLCTFHNAYVPTKESDECHYLPMQKELTCSDCARIDRDMACAGCDYTDLARRDGVLCAGYIDRLEDDFTGILMSWKVKGIYDRTHINDLIDMFESDYSRLVL